MILSHYCLKAVDKEGSICYCYILNGKFYIDTFALFEPKSVLTSSHKEYFDTIIQEMSNRYEDLEFDYSVVTVKTLFQDYINHKLENPS